MCATEGSETIVIGSSPFDWRGGSTGKGVGGGAAGEAFFFAEHPFLTFGKEFVVLSSDYLDQSVNLLICHTGFSQDPRIKSIQKCTDITRKRVHAILDLKICC